MTQTRRVLIEYEVDNGRFWADECEFEDCTSSEEIEERIQELIDEDQRRNGAGYALHLEEVITEVEVMLHEASLEEEDDDEI